MPHLSSAVLLMAWSAFSWHHPLQVLSSCIQFYPSVMLCLMLGWNRMSQIVLCRVAVCWVVPHGMTSAFDSLCCAIASHLMFEYDMRFQAVRCIISFHTPYRICSGLTAVLNLLQAFESFFLPSRHRFSSGTIRSYSTKSSYFISCQVSTQLLGAV